MAKIANKPISTPQEVKLELSSEAVTVTGPKGQLQVKTLPGVKVTITDAGVVVEGENQLQQTKAFVGLFKALLKNSLVGVTSGYSKTLKLVGTGYRVSAVGKNISLAVGFSHTVEIAAPAGIELKVEGQDTIKVSGFDKQAVGQFAANIRKVRPPEPYKGKGIRYENEVVRRKQGKAAATK